MRQHTDQCIVPADLPTVTARPWPWNTEPGAPPLTELIVLEGGSDVAGYSDAPGVLTIDGGDVPVPIAQAEEQALAVLAVARAMRDAGLGELP